MTSLAAPPDPRLRRGSHVVVHEPDSPEGQWVVQVGDDQYLRIGADAARLLTRLDGRPLDELVDDLGEPWTAELVRAMLERLERAGLLGESSRPRRYGRVKVVPPLTVQFAVVRDSTRLLRPVAPVLMRVDKRRAGQLAAVLAVSGLVALLAQAQAVVEVLGSSARPHLYLAVVLALLATNVLHELVHAGTLVAYGGRPGRLGFMILYLAPAFFCDVSDAWRLPSRSGRVTVALAGPASQFTLGGCAALAAVNTGGDGRWVLLVYAMITYVQASLNLMPLLKFDGYIALMSRVDAPFLRQRAIRSAQDAVGALVFGGSRPSPERTWHVWFGLGCILAPLVVLFNAVAVLLGVLAPLGLVAGLVAGAVVTFLGLRALTAGWKVAALAVSRGAPVVRVCFGLALSAGLLLGLGAVPVESRLESAWYERDGVPRLVVPAGIRADELAAGSTVRLHGQGMLLREHVGDARIASLEVEQSDVPVRALLPLEVDGSARLPTVRLTDREPAGTGGVASIERPARPLAVVLLNTVAGAVVGHR